MFEKFPSLTRFSHDWTVTEKLDGSNGQILIVKANEVAAGQVPIENKLFYHGDTDMVVLAGSRSRLLSAEKSGDNYGFAKFVKDNAAALVEALGEGRHFGEWVGNGITRGYNLSEKRFVLFNTHRWTGVQLPPRVDVVPILKEGYIGDVTVSFENIMFDLKQAGSTYAPGFTNPEGIVMRHGPSGTLFKKTFDYDEQGKWAENEERKLNQVKGK